MQTFPINFLALLVATIAKGAIGWLWYSPVLFLKPWLALNKMDEAQMQGGMGKAILVETIANFVMAFVLVHAVHYAGAMTAVNGAIVGFMNGVGFVFAVLLAGSMYEKKPFKLVAINSGYQIVGLMVMGAIVAVWT